MIFVNKVWPFDPHIRCLKTFNFASVCEVEFIWIKNLHVKFEDEVECKELPKVYDRP